MEQVLSVGELKRLALSEGSKNEFSPVIGAGVERTDKSNNGKAYQDSKKRIKDFNTVAPDKAENPKATGNGEDFNRTMLGLESDSEVSDDFKKRVKRQASGHYGPENNIEQDPSVEFNDKIYNDIKKREDMQNKAKADRKGEGLVGSKMSKAAFKKNSLAENIKTVTFNRTKFINEEHMISRIPDVLKVEGQKFHMKDNGGNDYFVRWTLNEAEILSHTNEKLLNESLKRMAELYHYNPEVNTKTKRRQL